MGAPDPVEAAETLHVFHLAGKVLAKRPDSRISEVDGAAAVLRLRLVQEQAATALREGAPDIDRGVRQIDVLALEG